MTAPTTPRDAIGLSERLRAWAPMIASGYECPAASTAMHEAATALDALQARVKELEAGWHDCITELTAEKKRVQELEAEQAAIVRDYQRMNSQLADEMKHATSAEQERDKLSSFAQELSDALLACRPLGGSELFVRRSGRNYADPVYCKAAIEQRIEAYHEAMKESVRNRKRAEKAEQERDEALERAAKVALMQARQGATAEQIAPQEWEKFASNATPPAGTEG